MTSTKNAEFDVQVKALDDQGRFSALVSVFNNVDLQNERVMPGAFDRTIAEHRLAGTKIPVLFGHDPNALVGAVPPQGLKADKVGLTVDGQLDLGSMLGQESYNMLRAAQANPQAFPLKWSFGYNERISRPAENGIKNLIDLQLGEVSITSRPANPATQTLAVKADTDTLEPEAEPADPEAEALETKAGRTISKATASELQAIHDEIGALQSRLLKLMGAEGIDQPPSDTAGKAADLVDLDQLKAAVGVHHTATSTGSWDGPANDAHANSPADPAYYRRIYAWSDDSANTDVKANWKFIHHEVAADGTPGPANLTAASTGIGVLNGARGGSGPWAGDRAGIYAHLAAHLKDAGQTPPALKSFEPPSDTPDDPLAVVPVRSALAIRVEHELAALEAE